MIVDLPSSTRPAVNKKLVDLRESGGVLALGRVLTLVIITDDGSGIEGAIEAANDASREHPCRVIVLARGQRRAAARLDAQIRVGGDAGASEVIVLRGYGPLAADEAGAGMVMPLLLPDAPVVAWWPGEAPAVPSEDPIGSWPRAASPTRCRRRTRSKAFEQRRANHAAGDTDLAWTRLTHWRALLAAALDFPPHDDVTAATVTGETISPSTDLMAGWLACRLGVPGAAGPGPTAAGMVSVRLERRSGPVELLRPDGRTGTLRQPGQPDRLIALARRTVPDCLAEELRRLDPDDVYGEALAGVGHISRGRSSSAASSSSAKPASTRARPADKPAKTGERAGMTPSPHRAGAPDDPPRHRRPREPGRAGGRRGGPAGHAAGRRPGRRAGPAAGAHRRRDRDRDARAAGATARPATPSTGGTSSSSGATSGSCRPATPSATRRRPARRCSTTCRVDPARVHAMGADTGTGPSGAEAAAQAYADLLAGQARPEDHGPVPAFDVTLLGMGGEGHTASVFPHSPAVYETERTVVAVHDCPKPPPTRVSLTLPAIRRSTEVWILATGDAKAGAVALALERRGRGRDPGGRGDRDAPHAVAARPHRGGQAAPRPHTADRLNGPGVLHLVVDAANVVGSRPDGWWRDRAGAARRLAGSIVAVLVSRPEDLVELLDGTTPRSAETAGSDPCDGGRAGAPRARGRGERRRGPADPSAARRGARPRRRRQRDRRAGRRTRPAQTIDLARTG